MAQFTWRGVVGGARQCAPVAISVFAYGTIFGILARQAGLSPLESILMSGLVFAGSSQFVALGLWAMPLPVGAIILTTLVVNLRLLFFGASLRPWLRGVPLGKIYPTLFLLTDEDWALTLSYFNKGGDDAGFLLGSGVDLYVAWVGATVAGFFASAAIPDPTSIGLDFAFTAVFLALLVGMWQGKARVQSWLGAALVALAAKHCLPGAWYIILGGLAGALIGMIRHED